MRTGGNTGGNPDDGGDTGDNPDKSDNAGGNPDDDSEPQTSELSSRGDAKGLFFFLYLAEKRRCRDAKAKL